MTTIGTTPGGINTQPRTPMDNAKNWQRLAAFLVSGVFAIDPKTGGLAFTTSPLGEVLAGPRVSSHTPGPPAFRTLDADDIPITLNGLNTTGNATVSGQTLLANATIVNLTVSNTLTLSAEPPNVILAGPTSGSAAAPNFRSQVAADLPGGNWIGNTCTNVLITPFAGNVTHTSNGVWQDTTLSNTQNFVAIPAAGTYLIGYSVHCTFQSAVVADEMCFRLFDETAGAECGNSSSFSQQILVANASQTIQTSHSVVVTFTGATNVRLEMLWSTAAGSGGPTTANISSGPLGHSTIFFVRIA